MPTGPGGAGRHPPRSAPAPATACVFGYPAHAMTAPAIPQGPASAPQPAHARPISPDVDVEVLLEHAQRHAFSYFEEAVDPASGLVLDSTQPDSPCSIAAVGLALTAWPIAIVRGW